VTDVARYRRLQNSKAFAGLKVGRAKIFNFSPNIYKLSNSISRDRGDSSDSNHTKYIPCVTENPGLGVFLFE
jgi:hypothetical protein